MPISIGKAIRIIREAKRKPLNILAGEAGLSTSYLSLVESDNRNPSMDVLGKLSVALGIPVDVFILIGSKRMGSLTSGNNDVERLINIFGKLAVIEKELFNAVNKHGSEETAQRPEY